MLRCFSCIPTFILEPKVIPKDKSSGMWRRHPDLNRGMKVLQTLALPLGYSANYGAGNEIRTRDVHLGKVTLYH